MYLPHFFYSMLVFCIAKCFFDQVSPLFAYGIFLLDSTKFQHVFHMFMSCFMHFPQSSVFSLNIPFIFFSIFFLSLLTCFLNYSCNCVLFYFFSSSLCFTIFAYLSRFFLIYLSSKLQSLFLIICHYLPLFVQQANSLFSSIFKFFPQFSSSLFSFFPLISLSFHQFSLFIQQYSAF